MAMPFAHSEMVPALAVTLAVKASMAMPFRRWCRIGGDVNGEGVDAMPFSPFAEMVPAWRELTVLASMRRCCAFARMCRAAIGYGGGGGRDGDEPSPVASMRPSLLMVPSCSRTPSTVPVTDAPDSTLMCYRYRYRCRIQRCRSDRRSCRAGTSYR